MQLDYPPPRLNAQTLGAADQLPAPLRQDFLDLQLQASAEIAEGIRRFRQGNALRRRAWHLHRQYVLEQFSALSRAVGELEARLQLGLTKASLERMLKRAAENHSGCNPAVRGARRRS